ncbi:hypothetical protein [Ramlibacter algicola]|uniref:GGDEF domain-containing protein n=1 Tax=Ramlibacter algicola TaxID=2795217 RepID=A0A934Q4F7_9BURK|nr:hypothetical protein [Ramlibacter algicola]MBK0394713.1 hypothetical protein [Ramlibacter algicola]
MSAVSIGFWGAFFGSTAFALTVAVLAFWRAAPKVASTTSLAILLSCAYAVLFLGWVPGLGGVLLMRLQALVGVIAAAILCLLLFILLGTFRTRRSQSLARWAAIAAALAASTALLALPPHVGLQFAVGITFLVAGAAILVSMVSARRGERAGWFTLAGLPCACLGMAGLDWYALRAAATPWQVHIAGAMGGMGFIACFGTAMWSRYAYLIEVRNVVSHGPNFDPVSRMPTYVDGDALQTAFSGIPGRGYGVVVVSLSNLEALEQLHGRAAYNHAVFVCASRLRRLQFAGVDLIRLPEDSFALLTQHPESAQHLIDQARRILRRLTRPITLQTSQHPDEGLEGPVWEASVGLGVILEPTDCSVDLVIAGARSIARSAWSFDSCMAWFDEVTNSICELPLDDRESSMARDRLATAA